MKIKMLEQAFGSEDGIKIKSFADGEIYEVVDDLGNAFVNMAVAERVTDKSVITIEKAEDKAPENKALNKSDYQNKSSKKAK